MKLYDFYSDIVGELKAAVDSKASPFQTVGMYAKQYEGDGSDAVYPAAFVEAKEAPLAELPIIKVAFAVHVATESLFDSTSGLSKLCDEVKARLHLRQLARTGEYNTSPIEFVSLQTRTKTDALGVAVIHCQCTFKETPGAVSKFKPEWSYSLTK